MCAPLFCFLNNQWEGPGTDGKGSGTSGKGARTGGKGLRTSNKGPRTDRNGPSMGSGGPFMVSSTGALKSLVVPLHRASTLCSPKSSSLPSFRHHFTAAEIDTSESVGSCRLALYI